MVTDNDYLWNEIAVLMFVVGGIWALIKWWRT
jgi:hypothetical protein